MASITGYPSSRHRVNLSKADVCCRIVQAERGLVADRPDVLIGVGGDVVKALFEASKGSIPIVGGVSDDPVRAGIATSLSRPGKNFTGVTFITVSWQPSALNCSTRLRPPRGRLRW
jgi:ABC transporter substrate binding protein